jgi:hypothetical protein
VSYCLDPASGRSIGSKYPYVYEKKDQVCAIAWSGVWPRVSRSGRVSDTGWSGGSSVMIMLSTLACGGTKQHARVSVQPTPQAKAPAGPCLAAK